VTRFKLLSDLHLEFYKDNVWKPIPSVLDKDTVLLLAGDIGVGMGAKSWITEMCGRYRYVIYILGNHEFYRQEIFKLKRKWNDVADMPENFIFLDNAVTYIDDVRILGSTLWTNIVNPHNRWFIQQGMSDYRVIKINHNGNYRKLNTGDTDREHTKSLYFLSEELRQSWPGKTIVMTHHLPHPLCVAERFKNSPYNDGFVTNLDYIFEKFDIDVWCHGHTHDNVDVHVGKTRILCNPRGYHGYEINPDFNEDLIFEWIK
jgi:predicted phosphohydrolase